MQLILAIEPDRRQAAQLSVVVRKRVHAELILVETTERALDAIGNRMPDLVLVPALLSPQDDAALAAALRVIAAAAHVQMLTIPVLGAPRPAISTGGMLSVLRRGKAKAAEPDGCDPAVFAEQIASYLEAAARERPPNAVAGQPVRDVAPADPHPSDSSPESPSPAYESPSLAYESPSLKAAAPVEQPSVTVGETVTEDWMAPLPGAPEEFVDAVEPDTVSGTAGTTGPDESVSFALEEAVRALFADPAPAAVEREPETVAPAEIVREPVRVAAKRTETVAAKNVEKNVEKEIEKDEWASVDELIAALHLMPMAAIEVTAEDEWIAPILAAPQHVADRPEQLDDDSSPAPAGAKSEREWVALIESLRHDVERLRVERSEKPGRKAPEAVGARADKADKTDRPAKPVQDEWGFFDPQQCGFAALLAKLDEVTDSDDGHT